MAAQRFSIEPAGPLRQRARGSIVARGIARRVQDVVPVGGRIAISYHEGFAGSPGGIVVLHRGDFSPAVSATGVFGPIDASGDLWIASGPLWNGRRASTRLVDPRTLAVRDAMPLASPFARTGPHRIIAHTPVRVAGDIDGVYRELDRYDVDPGEVRAGRLDLPERPGLVELDLASRSLRLLAEAAPFDPFTLCALSPDRAIAYAASNAGGVVAIDLAGPTIRWKRIAPRPPAMLCLYAIAIDAEGARLAVAGTGRDSDLLVLDTTSGDTLRELPLCRLLDQAGVARRPNARVEALAFHRSGWLAIATSSGAIAELRPDGTLTAFRAAGAGIDAMAFVDEGSALLVGGKEPQLRLWPVDI
jgi:hypothetical protein